MKISPAIGFCLFVMLPGLLGAQDTLSKNEIRKPEANYLVQNKPWTIEIPLWIPGYAGEFAYGDISVEGDEDWEPVNPIEPPPEWDFGKIFKRVFSYNWYLKFFFLTKIAYENKRILAQFDALAGSVGEIAKSANLEKMVCNLKWGLWGIFRKYEVFVPVYGKCLFQSRENHIPESRLEPS